MVMKERIPEDSKLIQEAQMVKTGANVHTVSTAICLYRNECILGNREKAEQFEIDLRKLIAQIRYETQGKGE